MSKVNWLFLIGICSDTLQDLHHQIFVSWMAKINFMTSTSRSEISPSVVLETPEHMREETLWAPSLTCDSDTQRSSEDEQVSNFSAD